MRPEEAGFDEVDEPAMRPAPIQAPATVRATTEDGTVAVELTVSQAMALLLALQRALKPVGPK